MRLLRKLLGAFGRERDPWRDNLDIEKRQQELRGIRLSDSLRDNIALIR